MTRLAVVIGASSGLGAAMLESFTASGWRAVGTSRKAGKLEVLDVGDTASVLSLANRLNDSPDVLVLNAGFGIAGPVELTSEKDAIAQIDTNMIGVHRVVRAFLPLMRARGSGTIVIVGSIASRLPIPFQALYCASKAGIASYAGALAMELAPFGVRVMLVEPGDHQTSFGAARRRTEAAGDPYEPSTSKAIAAMQSGEEDGGDPARLAARVVVACERKRPPHRLTVAGGVERLFLAFAAVVPAPVLHSATRWAFGVK